jgi:glycosyltransferase involved in cell wall biosynthesis
MNDHLDVKKRPTGVAYLSPGWPRGFVPNGIASYVANAYDALKSLGVAVHVLSTKTRFGFRSQDVKTVGDRNCERRLGGIIAQVRKLKVEKKIEIFEMGEIFGWAHRVAQDLPVPLVVKLHGPWFLNGKANGVLEDEHFIKRVKDELQGLQSAAGVTAPSQDVLTRTQAYYGVELKNSRVIANPIKTVPGEDRWQLGKCDKKKILFVGRFDRHKGADILIEAFATIARKMPATELLFVGPDLGLEKDGKCWGIKDYIRRVMPAAYRGNVRWLGQLSAEAITKLRKKSFITIIPSRYENFGNVLLESMSFGCPTVASSVGGNPEIMEQERNGLLFQTEDPDDLAGKALRLLGDEVLAERLGKQAAEDMETKYHPQKIARQMLDYYAEILGQN